MLLHCGPSQSIQYTNDCQVKEHSTKKAQRYPTIKDPTRARRRKPEKLEISLPDQEKAPPIIYRSRERKLVAQMLFNGLV